MYVHTCIRIKRGERKQRIDSSINTVLYYIYIFQPQASLSNLINEQCSKTKLDAALSPFDIRCIEDRTDTLHTNALTETQFYVSFPRSGPLFHAAYNPNGVQNHRAAPYSMWNLLCTAAYYKQYSNG